MDLFDNVTWNPSPGTICSPLNENQTCYKINVLIGVRHTGQLELVMGAILGRKEKFERGS